MKSLKSSVLFITGMTALASCNTTTKNDQEKSTPNIIYIMADDLGHGDLGVYGQKYIQTPEIDKMASEGIMFHNHYSGTAVCAPSRCVLMTGKHNGHTWVRGNKEADPYGQVPLGDSEITVAEKLKEAGYVTGMIGKWGLGVENTEGDPKNQGFDYFYGYYCQVHAHNSFPEYIYENGEKRMLRNKVKYMPKDHWSRGLGGYAIEKVDYSNDLFQEKTFEFLEENKDTSFFLYLPVTIPHDNGEAPEPYRFETPDLGIYADKDWSVEEKSYAAMISRLDSMVGDILSWLKEKGLAENTLVIFTSDNGAQKEDMFDSNGILRGKKRDLYEGGIKMPFIGWWPGKIKPGSHSDHISVFYDFLPTVCDLVNVNAPESTDGISYLPALLGQDQKAHEYLYWEFFEFDGTIAVRKDEWKAVKTGVHDYPDRKIELYDLQSDPSETSDVSDQHPEIVKEMEEIIKNEHVQSEIFPFRYEQLNP